MSAFVNKTIGEILKDTVDRHPDHEALVYPELKIRQNYKEFYEMCRTVAKGFLALGVKKNEHISFWTTNVPEWVYM